ncbi:hypothetical protein BSKO_04544 [Bryopsis sp. KO-2023]|nr:hypothetical protein BSKO_04544 [Bryopsis sp. KO-2023]
MSLYDLELHRYNGHPPSAVFTVPGQSLCVNCFVDTLNDGESFNTRKTHTVRQLLGILQSSGQAFVHDLVSSQASLLARGIIDALATSTVPSLSSSLIGICQLLCQATNYATEIFFERLTHELSEVKYRTVAFRLIILLAAALDPQNVENVDLQGLLFLLAWFLKERCPSLEGVHDVGPLICIVQHLILVLESDLEENIIHPAIRILSRACLHPILFNQAKPVGLALLKNISQLTIDRKSQTQQELCLELLQNCIRSGFLPSILSESLQSDPYGLNKTLQHLCQGLKTLLLHNSEQIQIEACQIVSSLTCMSADAALRGMMSGELCEHLFEALRCVEAWKSIQNKETMESHCLEALKQLSCAGDSFDEHFVYGRSVIIEVARDKISSGNQLPATSALELLHRAFLDTEKNPTINLLDARDLIEALSEVFPEYEDRPEKIDFPEARQKMYCLACDVLGWICNNLTEHWDALHDELRKAFCRSMSGWSMMKNDALEVCFLSGCRFLSSYCHNLMKESKDECDEFHRNIMHLLFLMDLHAIPALLSVAAENSTSSQALCLAFESLSSLFKKPLQLKNENIKSAVSAFCETLMSLKWIQFSFKILSKNSEAESLRKAVWGLLVKIMHLIDEAALFQGNLPKLLDGQEESVNGRSELTWQIAIHVMYACCLHEDYFFEPEFLMEALCRSITQRQHQLERNDVVFKFLRVYAETETILMQFGCQENQRVSELLIGILSKRPIVSISATDPAAQWILKNSNELSRRMVNFWISKADGLEGCEEMWYLGSIAFAFQSALDSVGMLIETLQEMQGQLCEKPALKLLQVLKIMGSESQEIASRLLMGGLWSCIRRIFMDMDASPHSHEHLFDACITCMVQCIATAAEGCQLDEYRDIMQTSLKKFGSFQCENAPPAALSIINLVNVVVYKTAIVSSLEGGVRCEKEVQRLFDALGRHTDFTCLIRSLLHDTVQWASATQHNSLIVASLQFVLLATINEGISDSYANSSVFVGCALRLRGLGRCLAIRCLEAAILHVTDWTLQENVQLIKGAIAVVGNCLWDEMPPVRQASIHAFATILEVECTISNQESINWAPSLWYPMIFEEIFTCLAANRTDFPKNQTASPEPLLPSSQGCGETPELPLGGHPVLESNWDVECFARCVRAALGIDSCQDWLVNLIRTAVDERRLFQTLLCSGSQTRSPDVMELVIALLKSGHVDFALARIDDALKGAVDWETFQSEGDLTCGQQEVDSMPFDSSQEPPAQEWGFVCDVFVVDPAATSPTKVNRTALTVQDALNEVENRRRAKATRMHTN